MKKPPQLDALSLGDQNLGTGGTYPPLGFRPIWDGELGNGDYFGLYWPYGHENREPMVCDMLHDEWGMAVSFSSIGKFLEWLELNDGGRGDLEVDDPAFVGRRFQEAKRLLANQPEAAIASLRSICEDFPESTEYWQTLASQLRRIGDVDGCHAAALRAFASNWAFGLPQEGTLRLLRSANGKLGDPLVARSDQISLQFGGVKVNTMYELLKECISDYLSSGSHVLGLLLNQNYGYMMSMETVSFQERYDFDSERWLEEHSSLCSQYLGDSRTRVE